MTRGDVTTRYSATAVREHADIEDELAGVFIDELIRDMSDPTWPAEMLTGATAQVLTGTDAQALATPDHRPVSRPLFEWATETVHGFLERAKRAAVGVRRFCHYRVRAALADTPNWALLATIAPRSLPKRRRTRVEVDASSPNPGPRTIPLEHSTRALRLGTAPRIGRVDLLVDLNKSGSVPGAAGATQWRMRTRDRNPAHAHSRRETGSGLE